MRLLFDEDAGGRIPHALRALKINARAIGEKGGRDELPKGTPDESWIPIAGRERMLVISCNMEIVRVEQQRALWIEHKVGGIFLTTGQFTALDIMRFMLRRLEWLEVLDATEERPFAFRTSLTGRAVRIPLL